MKWLLLSIVVGATALSDLLQSHEMKKAGEQSIGARGLARLLKTIVRRRELILSIVCLAISFFASLYHCSGNLSGSFRISRIRLLAALMNSHLLISEIRI